MPEDCLDDLGGGAPALGAEGAGGLERATTRSMDDIERRAIEGREEEIRQAFREGDEMREWIRERRLGMRGEGVSDPALAYVEAHKRALEGWTDDDLLALERRWAAGHEGEIQQAFREGDEMRDWIRHHRR